MTRDNNPAAFTPVDTFIIKQNKQPVGYLRLSGIYFLIEGDEIVYVGQTENIYGRVATHFTGSEYSFEYFSFMPCEAWLLDLIESFYIQALKPKHNRSMGRMKPKDVEVGMKQSLFCPTFAKFEKLQWLTCKDIGL